MLRQILLSLVVLVVAGGAYVWFVPGAADTLARFGITLPVVAATAPDAPTTGDARRPGGGGAGGPPQAGGGGGPPQGGPGGRGGGRFARDMVVVTAPVGTANINNNLNAIGEGEAAHSVTVMSPATGTLRDLVVRPGQQVEAGDVIGHLDAESERIAFDRARLAKDDADSALARTQELARANSATTVQINAAQLAADNAALELENAELALSRRTITSPIGGSVGLFQVSPGNAVSAQTVVTTIEDTEHILISFWVPERFASAVGIGLPIRTAAVALPGETIPGEIVAVDNRIDPASRTLKVQAEIPNESGRLRPGMSFSVTMEFDGDLFPTVDPLSIQWSSEGSYVWKYADGQVQRLAVEIIQRNSDGVLVKGDLAVGDHVVTQGVQQLAEGAQVRLLEEIMAPQRQARAPEGP